MKFFKCSTILKALTCLVLALLMVFGTVSTSIAAVVEGSGASAAAAEEEDVTYSSFFILGDEMGNTYKTPENKMILSDAGYYYKEIKGDGEEKQFSILPDDKKDSKPVAVDYITEKGAFYELNDVGSEEKAELRVWLSDDEEAKLCYKAEKDKSMFLLYFPEKSGINTSEKPVICAASALPAAEQLEGIDPTEAESDDAEEAAPKLTREDTDLAESGGGGSKTGDWYLKNNVGGTWDDSGIKKSNGGDDYSWGPFYYTRSDGNLNWRFWSTSDNNNLGARSSNADVTLSTNAGNNGVWGGTNSWQYALSNLESSGSNYYSVYVHLDPDGGDIGNSGNTYYAGWTWVTSSKLSAISPSITTKNGSTSTTSFTVGDTVTLQGGKSASVGTVSYSFEYKLSTASSYTPISGTSLSTASLTPGTYTIRVTATDGGVTVGTNARTARTETATKNITLAAATTPNITSITSSSSSLKIGEEATITTVLENTVSPTVTYTSSAPSVLSVTKVSNTSATIKALAPGSATITASLSDSGTSVTKTTSSISIATPTISSYYYGSNSVKSLLIGEASGNPTKSLTSGTYNTSSTVTWKYYLSSTGTTTDNTYATINADTGVLTAKSAYTAVTSSDQNAYAVATVSYNGVSYTTARKARTYNVYAYFLYGFGSSNWSMSEARMFTYDTSRSTWTNSQTLTNKTYTTDTGDGFKVVKVLNGSNTYYDASSKFNMTRSGNDNKDTALDSTTTGNIGLTADVAGTYVFDLTLNSSNTPTNIKPHYPQKVNYDKGGKTTTAFPTTPTYVTYNTAIGSAPSTTPAATGWTFTNWVTTSGGSTNFNFSSTKITSETTIYAKWTEVTAGIALTAYTDGSASTTGGTIQVGGANVTSVDGVGVNTSKTIVAVAKSANGYLFTGWDTDGANKAHIKLYTNSACTTTYTPGSGDTTTTLYIKTDGTSGMTTANSIIKAMFVNGNRTVVTGKMAATSGSGFTTSAASSLSPTISGGGNAVVGSDVTLTASATVTSGGDTYEFVGWYSSASASTSAANDVEFVDDGNEYTFELKSSSNLYYYAMYRKVYYLTFYTSWKENIAGGWDKATAAPRTVVVTKSDGSTVTFTYNNSATKGEETVKSVTGEYGEGNRLKVLAGDTVKATYSALASSEVISGIFHNEAIRYSTEDEYDNLYVNRVKRTGTPPSEDGWPTGDDDFGKATNPYTFSVDTTLYADESYYPAAIASTIRTNFNSYPAHDGVDQNKHTVEWTVAGNYWNIDIELASKKQIVFSDSVNAVIGSENTDNFYSVNEAITALTAAAAKSSTQTNKITRANIKFYYYNATTGKFTDASGSPVADSAKVQLTGADATISVAGSDSTSTSSANGSTLTFSGSMPATDVYIDLELVVTYGLYLDSKIVSDTSENKTKFCEVATVTAKKGTSSFQSQSSSSTGVKGPGTVTAGETVTYSYSLSSTWSAYYMFVGWYKGTSSGPDYNNGLLSTKDTFTYKPTGSTYVYAVGTRDLFINGSKYIIGGNTDWPSTNLKMKFDPSYYNSATGKQGRYYWEITDTIFSAASRAYNKGDGTFKSGDNYYWNNNTAIGNSAFQFFDTATKSDSNENYWRTLSSFVTTGTDAEFGLVYPRDENDDYWRKSNATGYIKFDETTNKGYSTPLYIYAYPGATGFSVSATPVYPHIYVSNGYKGIDVATNGTPSNVSISVNGTASGNNSSAANSTQGKAYYNGSGWTPSCEGTVRDITIQEKNATVTFTKTTASADYKVSAFVVYNLAKDTVKSYTATNTSGNTYTASVKMNNDESLYVVPVVEKKTADLTVIIDSTQMNTTEWGDLIGCYAWYQNGSNTAPLYGAYPGQLMIPSDDGKSWSASFPSKVGNNELVGITFSNYYDGSNTWLGGTNVLGTIIPTYNTITKSDSTYNKTNFKAQTYDYREPIAYYKKSTRDSADSTLLTFALKDGNSNLIAWTHSDLVSNNILTYKTVPGQSNWEDISFEHLTDMNGNYVDMNGDKIEGHPTPSFYVAAKGQATYVDNSMERIFWTGQSYQTPTTSVPSGKGGYGTKYTYNGYYGYSAGEIDMDFAVQWYVYDASGNYITTVLSSGFADMNTADSMTLIAEQLDNLGYGTSGRSIAICYDESRYCYSKSGEIANTGTTFDAYRFTGQWHMENAYSTAKVYAKVGMMTDNGEVIYDTSSAAFGSATVAVDATKLSHASSSEYFGTGTEAGEDGTVSYAYTTIVDGSKQAISLTASATNFKGWYYYNSDNELVRVPDTDEKTYTITPSYSKDVTYYAIFEANAIYQYQYTGREGGENAKSYSSAGGYLTDAEITAGNIIAKTRTDFGDASKMPGANAVSLFKKDITWDNNVTQSMLDNGTEYVMKISNATITTAKYNLTYYYPASAGGASTAHEAMTNVEYNKLINLRDLNISSLAGSGRVFQGWYEANSSGVSTGKLLSTSTNFGQVIVKDTVIVAVFGSSELNTNENWEVYIDDAGVTREMYTADSGQYYNDVIVCARKNNVTADSLPEGAVVGALFVDDNGTNNTINTSNLSTFANALSSSSGKSGKSNGCTVTNVFTSTVTKFGRADLALRADYKTSVGHKYYVYAYVKIGNTYYFDTTGANVSGTYAAYSVN